MNNQSKVIVLNTHKHGDYNLVVSTYSAEFGRKSFFVNNNSGAVALRQKALFFPLSVLKVDYQQVKSSSMPKIVDVFPDPLLKTINGNFEKSITSLFLSELLIKSIKENEVNEDLFFFLENAFVLFDIIKKGTESFHLLFMIYLSRYLGFFPRNNKTEITPYFSFPKGGFVTTNELGTAPLKVSAVLSDLFSMPMSDVENLSFNLAQRGVLLKGLLYYYQSHIPHFGEMKTLSVYASLFGVD